MIKRFITIIFLMGTFIVKGLAQDTTSTSAIVLPLGANTIYSVNAGGIVNILSAVSVTLNPDISLLNGSTVKISISNVLPSNPANDFGRNWIVTTIFDENGTELGATKSFFDNNGKPVQTQTKNESAQQVLASATVYDLQDRGTLTTLAAPINNSTFAYKNNFISTDGSTPYSYNNFDWNNGFNSSSPYAKTTSPDAVDNSQPGTLGWYYSDNNTLEPFVATTAYPYTRSDYYHDGSQSGKRSAGIGEQLIMGQNHEMSSNSFPVQNELNNYLTIRNQCFPSTVVGNTPGSLAGQALQTLTKDQNGLTAVSITDLSGKQTFMSGRADPTGWLGITNSISISNSQTYYDAVNYVYHEPSTNALQYFQLVVPSVVSISGGGYTLYNMATEQDVTSAYPSGSTMPAGYYKIIAAAPSDPTSMNTITVSYKNNYADISYNYYNQLGQLIASVAPNGVQMLINSPDSYTNPDSLPFTTHYEYDLQGRLVASTSTDGGRTEFIYRQDGKIRFSQNAEQRMAANGGRFSYTNYDGNSRPFESGEYVPQSRSDLQFASLKTNTSIQEDVTVTGGVTGGLKQDWVKTHYDSPDNSHGLTAYVQDEGFLKSAVSWTENTNSKTWYSYDDHGRVTWMIKQLATLNAPKTVNYTYNDQGNVIQVDYQHNTASERFLHYYAYDADGRLLNVQTSRDGNTFVQQAKYYYYLHGPLKRVELGNQLQGVDYVYTPQGWLKSINHPSGDPAKDPMHDGGSNSFAPDAYGMQLEYFPNDYVRGGTSISSIGTGTASYYDGNVNGMSWQSKKPQSVVSAAGTGIQNPTMYTYSYDPKYQLTAAIWGTPNFNAATFTGSSAFSENGLSYDANGNIQSLKRTNAVGAASDNFSYAYTDGTNKLENVSNYGSYTYDNLGQLKSASQVGVPFIMYFKYDVSGKITGVFADAALTQQKVGYTYDEMGNRISRTDYTGSQPITASYVFDGDGNYLAIYKAGTETELPFYGADRLGIYTVANNDYAYELRDNVGSVRAVVNQTKVNGNQTDIFNYSDYYPFGSISRSGGTNYRYDYQGAYAEKDSITNWNNFYSRMYDSRIGRWLSVDPQMQYASPYVGMGNNPLTGFDPTGGFDDINTDSKTGATTTIKTDDDFDRYSVDGRMIGWAYKGDGGLSFSDGSIHEFGNFNEGMISHLVNIVGNRDFSYNFVTLGIQANSDNRKEGWLGANSTRWVVDSKMRIFNNQRYAIISLYAHNTTTQAENNSNIANPNSFAGLYKNGKVAGQRQYFQVPEGNYFYQPFPGVTYLGTTAILLPRSNPDRTISINLEFHRVQYGDAGAVTSLGNNNPTKNINLPAY